MPMDQKRDMIWINPAVASAVQIPVIGFWRAGEEKHFAEAFQVGASAALAVSFSFSGLKIGI